MSKTGEKSPAGLRQRKAVSEKGNARTKQPVVEKTARTGASVAVYLLIPLILAVCVYLHTLVEPLSEHQAGQPLRSTDTEATGLCTARLKYDNVKATEKEVMETLMAGDDRKFIKMKVFHNGTAIFLPGQTHLLINPELENVEPTRLMIVNHYEAEVLLGGEELLSHPGKYMVVSAANLFKHQHAFESLMERWRIPRGLLLGLVHSFEESYRYPGMSRQPKVLYCVAWVKMLEDVICSRQWERILIPDLPEDEISDDTEERSLLGDLHKIVLTILQRDGALSRTDVGVMTFNAPDAPTSLAEHQEERNMVMTDIYQAPMFRWRKYIEHGGVIPIPEDMAARTFDIDKLLCQ